jgi:hypothetical protein
MIQGMDEIITYAKDDYVEVQVSENVWREGMVDFEAKVLLRDNGTMAGPFVPVVFSGPVIGQNIREPWCEVFFAIPSHVRRRQSANAAKPQPPNETWEERQKHHLRRPPLLSIINQTTSNPPAKSAQFGIPSTCVSVSQSVIEDELIETGVVVRSVGDAVTVGVLVEMAVLVLLGIVAAGIVEAGTAAAGELAGVAAGVTTGAGVLAATTEAGSVGIKVAIACAACGSSTEYACSVASRHCTYPGCP